MAILFLRQKKRILQQCKMRFLLLCSRFSTFFPTFQVSTPSSTHNYHTELKKSDAHLDIRFFASTEQKHYHLSVSTRFAISSDNLHNPRGLL